MTAGRRAATGATALLLSLTLSGAAIAEEPAAAPQPTALVFFEAVTRADTAMVGGMLADTPSLAVLKYPHNVTPLHAAALNDEPRLVEMLLKRGAPVDARGGEQKVTPLFLAVMKGHARVAKALMDRRADPNAKGLVPSDDGFDELRPLHLAAVGGFIELADLLVQRGAILSATSSTGSTAAAYARRTNNLPIAMMLSAYTRLGLVRGRPIAALLRAIAAQDSARIDSLLKREPSLANLVLDDHWTPLHLAAWTGSQPACDALIFHGANLRAEESVTHWTPALRAYDSGHAELCEYLRRRDSDSPSKGAR